ncbi:MAG: 2-oxo acid dehydrogenase subunit E2 [Mesorhizobium sp.]|uniref:dihydrolipoamide acetyltransferase family protein n=1 Tax=unclassified Mesorhizobium TaxID=325217 RepID=UPI000FD544C8|nr:MULTISPECIES: dihydrolipoamide acetyltransferase family protein [unclassified Mesorhizobium]RVD39498.1 2-oxo acid dehydrogenase subunit E2 [Mesorhizobium sp. M4A.F.Ca.ET.020.02.1.1]RWC18380.1 MAG: 2-oxo acid dehydrogenase subunit E2 [Mesorhizobium sp.]RWC27355.1 MAG: 2-oxo acid dehydrogenase subunit E2 [Mesorhizobium sp.]RWC55886.1 MAG: 2-oxo acid dehydrogenase subunit E2 [Mesorhizobium sp.]RWD42258.1 MAG: 2-oxo acid dehydrogenase subunit E2 [Mesorhizobium sp.]
MSNSFTEVALSPLRKAIAARMTLAKQTVPHFRMVAHIEADKLMRWRSELNGHHPNEKVSLNDCLVKAVAVSLVKHPSINCQMADNTIRQYHSADISIVIAVKGGLSTPVVRSAETKSVIEIAAETKDFVDRATRKSLKLSEISGGSFSISNLGGYGIEQFDAIINVPQCAILAVGSAVPRVVVDSSGNTRTATMMTFTLSVDHRAIDGAEASKFLLELRNVIGNPESLA